MQHNRIYIFIFLFFVLISSESYARKPDVEAVRKRVRQKGYTFEVGPNPATNYSIEELCGTRRPEGLLLQSQAIPAPKQMPLPQRFDWRELGGCTPIKNQGACGACWAFGAMGVAESQYLIQTSQTLDFSEQWLVSCTEAGDCGGGWYGSAFDYMITEADAKGQSGNPLEVVFPYQTLDIPCEFVDSQRYLLTNWSTVEENVDAIKQAIQTYGPVVVMIYAEELFQCYIGGVFNADVEGDSNHAVVLVGWDDAQGAEGIWFLRNSWGTGWGENGCMRIEYGRNNVGQAPAFAEFIPPEDPNALAVPDVYPTIQAAVDAASSGAVIILAPGTYTGPGNRDIDLGGKNLTIRSVNPADANCVSATVIDCQGAPENVHRAFHFAGGENSTSLLNGLTIRNGYVADNGGAVYCYYSHPTITNCIFENNTASGFKKAGGAIALYNSSPQISNCQFYGNTASDFGGAISCRDKSSPKISYCRILNNIAGAEGGGIYCWIDSMAMVDHTVIAKNYAEDAGGGLFFYECADVEMPDGNEPNSPVITFCTITENATNGFGGGLFCMDSIVEMNNSILWNNDSPQMLGDQIALMDDSLIGTTLHVNYCDVTGLDQDHWLEANCTLFWGDGNLDADPLFADPAQYDYHLQSASGHWDESTHNWVLDDGGNYDPADDQNSPCIDAGNPALPVGDELKCNGGRINIGAYGGLQTASRSHAEKCCMGCIQADLNCDCVINLEDLAVLVSNWLECNLLPRYHCVE